MQYEVITEKPEQEIYTVSQLNREARIILEKKFPFVWIEGELSNLSKPSSGHIYFTLKDETAQVRCAMFRLRNHNLDFNPNDGMHVLVKARVSLYEGRGDFQLIIESMEERGDGLLRRAFERLKLKLTEEGLFDAIHKKPLPLLPRAIGVITSPTGAAIRDVLTVLKRRFPSIPIIIYPTQVQGDLAPLQIVRAIELANHRAEADVLLLCRGGGSLEDLWSFNDERVARAIFASIIPMVSGVGHEVDFTIADFVADHRAATPSAAAELISPDGNEWLQRFSLFQNRIMHLIKTDLRYLRNQLFNLEKRLQSPTQRLQQFSQKLDHFEELLHKLILRHLHQKIEKLNKVKIILYHHNPQHKLQKLMSQVNTCYDRIKLAIKNQIHRQQEKLANVARALQAVSPLQTLERGYAILTKDKKIINDINVIEPGEKIKAEIVNGYLICTVDEVKPAGTVIPARSDT